MELIKCELCGSSQLEKIGNFLVCSYCGAKYTAENDLSFKALKKSSTCGDVEYYIEIANAFFGRKALFINYYKTLSGAFIRGISYCPIIIKNTDVFSEMTIEKFKECYDKLIAEIQKGNVVIKLFDLHQLIELTYPFENNKWIDFLKEYIDWCKKAAATIKSELSEYKKKGSISLRICGQNFSFSGESIEKIMYFDGTGVGNIVFTDDPYERPNKPSFYVTPEQFIKCVKEQNSTSGCYIATCVYGSYDCPEVWRLRRFRDSVLSKTWRGRLLIRTYYAISPKLVKWFGKTVWFKRIWKAVIDRIGLDLKNKGFDDTPYTDE